MRLVAAALILGLAAPAAAQPVAPLAANEVLLEVDATGTARRGADRARLLVGLTARGDNAAAARTALDAMIEQATAAARSAGIAAADNRPTRNRPSMGFVGNEASGEFELPAQMAAQLTPSIRVANRQLEIVVRDPAQAERVRDALQNAGVESVSEAIYELADERPARHAARAEALAGARSDAEAYAAAAGLRVARMLRISERSRPDATGWAVFAAMMRGRAAAASSGVTDVETDVHLEVDFALAPR